MQGGIKAYVAARSDRSLRDVASTTIDSRHLAKGKDEKEGDEAGREEIVVVPWVVWLLRRTPWLRQLVRISKKNHENCRCTHTSYSCFWSSETTSLLAIFSFYDYDVGFWVLFEQVTFVDVAARPLYLR